MRDAAACETSFIFCIPSFISLAVGYQKETWYVDTLSPRVWAKVARRDPRRHSLIASPRGTKFLCKFHRHVRIMNVRKGKMGRNGMEWNGTDICKYLCLFILHGTWFSVGTCRQRYHAHLCQMDALNCISCWLMLRIFLFLKRNTVDFIRCIYSLFAFLRF